MQRVVDVAVAVVSGQRPGFKPIVRSSIDGDLALETHGFSIVSDALYIALDNVSQHSGKKVDNKIDIEIKFEKESSLIYFRVESDVLSSAKTGEKEARLAEIRAGIQKKIFGERARMDRHSGLFKLAALVGQSDKTTMDFGFIGDNRFFLKFELVYVGITGSEESFISRENLVANVPAEIP